jgi:glycine/D-amino acid oxidase-like deaminating enzyme
MSSVAVHDVLVIGAGALGASIAAHLARLGSTVCVLDRDPERSGQATTPRSFGLVWAQSKQPDAYLELTLASIRYYPEFLSRLGGSCDYARPGGLVLLESEQHQTQLHELLRHQERCLGFHTEFLDGRATRQLEPAISEEVVGSTFSASDGHLDPQKLHVVMHAHCAALGVHIVHDAGVRSLHRQAGRWAAETSQGTFAAPVFVNCAGAWAAQLAGLVGVELAVRAVRGQIVRSAPMPPLLSHPTLDVRQGPDGRVWMGTVASDDDFGLDVRVNDTQAILATAARQVPALSSVTVERVWAGIRATTADGQPILDRMPQLPGGYVAVGHSGITLAPIIGHLMAEFIMSGRKPALMRPFSADRPSLVAPEPA